MFDHQYYIIIPDDIFEEHHQLRRRTHHLIKQPGFGPASAVGTILDSVLIHLIDILLTQ